MEGIGSEISQKIRAAIKAKLIELGAYVDDELPDYIMVMVANKRTRSQMDEDLQLFLGSNTKIFTSWLHTVLQKLQEVTVATFDDKKDSNSKKSSKRKRSVSTENATKKLTEDASKTKKHSKKHKDAKKAKKNKHKTKDKSKSKSGGKKKSKDDDDDSDKDSDNESSEGKSNGIPVTAKPGDKTEKSTKKLKEKKDKSKKSLLNEAVGKAILGSLKGHERLRVEKIDGASKGSSTEKEVKGNGNAKQNSVCEDEDVLNIRVDEGDGDDNSRQASVSKGKAEVVEDEFNIEPLKPTEKVQEVSTDENKKANEKKSNENSNVNRPADQPNEMTISAPTKELLREHDKLLSQVEDQKVVKDKTEEKEKAETDSDESLSPEEIRKQLLLSRAKKKLEESKLTTRMKSNSPDILILEKESKIADKTKGSSPVSRSPPHRMHISNKSSEFASRSVIPSKTSTASRSPVLQRSKRQSSKSSYSSNCRSRSISPPLRKVDIIRESKLTIVKSSNNDEGRRVSVVKDNKSASPITYHREVEKRDSSAEQNRSDKKKNLISISKSLELEKNLGVKKDLEDRRSKEKTTSPKKKPVPSRVVTIPEPEAPEIPSIVKVKPREYISKDKQANKALILKAVADAEKSIAIVHNRNDSDTEIKKPEALFTKDLRGKRFEKLAVTLSNDRAKRMISVDSDNSDALDNKDGDSESGKPEVTVKNITKKSEDHFISSKASMKEKNDKYIHCWLEGVEKAVIAAEIVNPNEIETLNEHPLTDEEREAEEGESSKKDDKRKRKKSGSDNASVENETKNPKLSDKEIANLRLIPNTPSNDDGPQIVVTLDGLNSKTIKDIILRNRGTPTGPLMNSMASKKFNEKDAKDVKISGDKFEKNIRITHKVGESINQASTSKTQEKNSSESKKYGFERISDRFGRINRISDNSDSKDKSLESSKNKFISPGESKNKKLIAQLSEKFGKVDREFDSKKRKYLEEERRYSYGSRRNEREDVERESKYKKSEKKSSREGNDYDELRRLKSKERCMFWPGCSKGTNCEYHHPTSPCKLLPNCKYREKCMYIHPLCKDDLHCHNRDCPYEHTPSKSYKNSSPKDSSRRVSLSPPSKYTSSSSNQTCRFYPNCKNLDCRYFHPKKCRYDDECTNPDCKYIHSQKKRPKWSSKS